MKHVKETNATILFFTVMKDSNRRNLLFVFDKPVALYMVGKDYSEE